MFDHPATFKPDLADDHKDINLLPEDLKMREIKAKRKPLFSHKEDVAFNLPDKSKPIRSKAVIPKPDKIRSGQIPAQSPGRRKFSFIALLTKLGLKRSPARLKSESIIAVSSPPSGHQIKPAPILDQAKLDLAKTDRHPLPPELVPPTAAKHAAGIDFIPTFKDTPAKNHPPQFHAVPESDKAFKENLDINLLPESSKIISVQKALMSYATAMAIAVAIVFIPYLILQFNRTGYVDQNKGLLEQHKLVKTKIAEHQTVIAGFGPMAGKLNHLENLFENHVYLSQFFSLLEKNTLPSIYFTALNIEPDLKIKLDGRAFNLRSLAEQLLIFKTSPDCRSVALERLALNTHSSDRSADGIEFSLSFTLDKSVVAAASSETAAINP